jgi:hypothetical protein
MEQTPLVICFLLDETRSMTAIKAETMAGFNEYIGMLRNDDSAKSALFALTKFNSDKIELVYDGIPLEKVEPLSDQNYHPAAITPLYDAIGKTIHAMKTRNENSPVLLVVQTDGQENASREFTQKMIRDLIEERRQAGWTFVFLGADIDAYTAASAIGISQGNTASYPGKKSLDTFRKAALAAKAYAATGGVQTDSFFVDQKENPE